MTSFSNEVKDACKGTDWNFTNPYLWKIQDGLVYTSSVTSYLAGTPCQINVKTTQTDQIIWETYGIWEPLVKPDSWLIKSAFALEGVPFLVDDAPKLDREDGELARKLISSLQRKQIDLDSKVDFDFLIEAGKGDTRTNHEGKTIYDVGETLICLLVQSGRIQEAIQFAKGKESRIFKLPNHGNMGTPYETFAAMIADCRAKHLEKYISPLRTPRRRFSTDEAELFSYKKTPIEQRFPE